MAQRAAIASGNWSNPAIWNEGVLPTVDDVVASNNYTITIDQDINIGSITNAGTTLTTAVPTMTSDTAPSGIASNSNTGGFSGRAAYSAFDGNVSNTCYAGTTTVNDWVAYEFSTPKKIGQFSIHYNGGSFAIEYSFDAWDGSTWVTIGTHNTSGGVTTSPMFTNTTSYIKYRILFLTGGVYTQINEFRMYEALSVAAAQGGGFILNDGVTAQANTFVTGGSKNLVECSITTGQSATIIGNITGGNISGYSTINFTGLGTLNIIGDLYVSGGQTSSYPLRIASQGTVNITGNVTSNDSSQVRGVVQLAGNCTLNVTGDVVWTLNGGTTTPSPLIRVESICTINVVGSVIGGPFFWAIGNTSITGSTAIYLSVIGPIIAREGNSSNSATPAIQNISGSSVIILTGPFISSGNGIQPIYVSRMHYQRTMGSYYEFRDNSTLGALLPSPPAPATRLVSPDTVVDAPIPANVRQGVAYASGSQTGTMVVPSPSNVANNVPVDNTVGTAVLDPSAIWAVPVTSISTSNSIGRRVKNAATVETTGAQIQQTLNNNE